MNTYEVQILLEAGYALSEIQKLTPHQIRNLAMECQAAEDEYYENLWCGMVSTKINKYLTLEFG